MKLLIHSQTSTAAQLMLMDWGCHHTLNYGCNYLSMLGLKLIHLSKGGPRPIFLIIGVNFKAPVVLRFVVQWHNTESLLCHWTINMLWNILTKKSLRLICTTYSWFHRTNMHIFVSKNTHILILYTLRFIQPWNICAIALIVGNYFA